jgi:probable rRNA maturation factor
MGEISFNSDDVLFNWEDEEVLSTWLLTITKSENRTIDSLSYVYCSDEQLLEMNRNHLNHDYYTDIITFDLSEDDTIEGEIYISLDRVKDNAKTFGVSFEEELCRVMSHGLLHLFGYDDHAEGDQKVMRAKETFCLSLLLKVPRGTFS